jgi:hypothetical protein
MRSGRGVAARKGSVEGVMEDVARGWKWGRSLPLLGPRWKDREWKMKIGF